MKVFEFFAGVGAQHKALSNININYEIVGISEWYINSIIGYDAIHNDNQIIINDYELKGTFSLDSKNPTKKISNDKLNLLKPANVRTKNFGSVVDIKGQDLPKIDVLTYSFPCQSLSLLGKNEGIKVGTRSGLLLEIERILNELNNLNKLPKFLLMENVKNILSPKHKPSLNDFLKILENYGYKNSINLLNSINFSIPQSRERVFIISELNGKNDIKIIGNKIIDIHSDVFDIIKTPTIGEYLDWNNPKYQNEYFWRDRNSTPYHEYMFTKSKELKYSSPYCNTIVTKQNGFPNAGVVKDKNFYRLLTPRECFRLMGFTNDDYDKLNKVIPSNMAQYLMAGNSIVVQVLEEIFKKIYTIGNF